MIGENVDHIARTTFSVSNLSLEASIYHNQGFWVKSLRKWERKHVREREREREKSKKEKKKKS
jgi:hypothetical protein